MFGSLVSCLGGSCLLAGYAAQSAYHYRALPDHSHDGEIAPSSRLRELDTRIVPLGLALARAIVLLATTTVMKLLMHICNQVEIMDDARYRFLLGAMRQRPAGVPLLTVCNHQSSLDDPGLMSAIIPWDVLFTPNRMRWAIATQDIVFPKKAFVQSFMTSGQVLPVHRGGGIDHPLLLDFARQMAAGKWVHVFPEARVVQTGTLATDAITRRSDEELAQMGRLKWGTGKLIAHSAVAPMVIPFYHYGMVGVLPQYNEWRKREDGSTFFHNNVMQWKPRWGNKVKVWIGDPVSYQDLIIEYENKHGPLRKVSPEPALTQEDFDRRIQEWKSSEQEKDLYSKITKRVEDALLEVETRAKEHSASNPDPKVKNFCERAVSAMKMRGKWIAGGKK